MLSNTLPGGNAVLAIAILNCEVFVLREETSELKVYDSVKLQMKRRLAVMKLIDPSSMASSPKYNCLYIAEGYTSNSDARVHRVNMKGKTIIWPLKNGKHYPHGMTVASDGENIIILHVPSPCTLSEYTTYGKFVRVISLQEDIICPKWAMQLFNRLFIVCHGNSHWDVDPLSRVCIVDDSGHIVRSCGGQPGSSVGQLNDPCHLDQDKFGDVVVADKKNQRICLFSSSLTYIRELVSLPDTKRPSWQPDSVCLDEMNGRLFVSDNSTNEVLIFKVK